MPASPPSMESVGHQNHPDPGNAPWPRRIAWLHSSRFPRSRSNAWPGAQGRRSSCPAALPLPSQVLQMFRIFLDLLRCEILQELFANCFNLEISNHRMPEKRTGRGPGWGIGGLGWAQLDLLGGSNINTRVKPFQKYVQFVTIIYIYNHIYI